MRLILLCLSVLLSACAVLRGPERPPELPLLSPESFGQQVQLTQRVSVEFDGERRTFLAAWAVAGDQLNFAGLTPSGQRLMTLSYGSNGFTEDYSALLEESLPGREVLTHLQLAHWPLGVIEEALAGSPWKINQTPSQRQLYFRGRLALSIIAEYQSGDAAQTPSPIRILSHFAPMALDVETLQVVSQ